MNFFDRFRKPSFSEALINLDSMIVTVYEHGCTYIYFNNQDDMYFNSSGLVPLEDILSKGQIQVNMVIKSDVVRSEFILPVTIELFKDKYLIVKKVQ